MFESNMMRLQLSKFINDIFAVIYLRSSLGRSQLISNAKWAVNQASINQKDVSNTPIIPPLVEQQVIAEKVESSLSLTYQIEKSIENDLKRAIRLRQSILKRAFEGKLVPQDPGDEPASMLLERIRAERERKAPRKGRMNGRNSTKQIELIQ